MVKKILKKTVKRGKTIVLRTTNARIRQDLGNGFRREVLQNFTIGPNRFLTINITAPANRRVISAGWTISAFLPAYATDSFPASDRVWTLVFHNPTSSFRTITPFIITKLA